MKRRFRTFNLDGGRVHACSLADVAPLITAQHTRCMEQAGRARASGAHRAGSFRSSLAVGTLPATDAANGSLLTHQEKDLQ
jgi:hypothetical protein